VPQTKADRLFPSRGWGIARKSAQSPDREPRTSSNDIRNTAIISTKIATGILRQELAVTGYKLR